MPRAHRVLACATRSTPAAATCSRACALALFLPVSRLAFRIDLAQVLLLFVVSALIDVARRLRCARGRRASSRFYGAGTELFSAALLLLIAAILALLFWRQRRSRWRCR